MARDKATNEVGSLYPPAVGLVFVFNLIVGTGAITMPNAFQSAGWLLSLIIVICIAFTSYITVTYVMECMACANAVLLYKKRISPSCTSDSLNGSCGDSPEQILYSATISTSTETSRLISGPVAEDYFSIRERTELGQMVSLFFNKIGVVLFYICIIVYLYGDLAIYAAAVPKSLRDVICVYKPNETNCTCDKSKTISQDQQCFPGVPSLSRMNVYRLCVTLFSFCLGPFVFFDVQKTTALQIVTSLLRWIAFLSMIILAIVSLSTKGPQRIEPPKVGDFSQLPNLFGVCVYSFMCHHSLPSLITPIRRKGKLQMLMAADYVLILVFYSLLCLTGIFAFDNIPDLYTLNFEPVSCPNCSNIAPVFFQYFLALFPVFTLSTSFPIIAITLRNNLKALFLTENRTYPFLVNRVLFPLLVLIPPVIVAIITNDLESLVGVTGAYAGAAIQYFIPIALLYCARKYSSQLLGGQDSMHKLRSPFGHIAWLIILTIWATAAIVFITVQKIKGAMHS